MSIRSSAESLAFEDLRRFIFSTTSKKEKTISFTVRRKGLRFDLTSKHSSWSHQTFGPKIFPAPFHKRSFSNDEDNVNATHCEFDRSNEEKIACCTCGTHFRTIPTTTTIPCYSLQTNNVTTFTVNENLSALRKILNSLYLIQRRAYKSSCGVTSPASQNAKIEILNKQTVPFFRRTWFRQKKHKRCRTHQKHNKKPFG